MKGKWSAIAFWAVVLLVVTYLIASVVPSIFSTQGISVESAESITYDETIPVTGIALRDEKILSVPSSFCSVDYKVSDGDRVAADDVLATYSSTNLSAQDQLAIESLDRQISILTESVASTTQYDLKALDERTQEAIRSYLDVTGDGNLNLTQEKTSEVMGYLIRRNIKAQNNKDYYQQILTNCESAKSAILRGNSATQSTVRANEAGYFSSGFDGFENFNAADYATPDVDTVRDLLDRQPQERPDSYVGKLQHYSYWSYLCTVPERYAAQFTVGSSWRVRFDISGFGSKVLSMTVRSVSSETDGVVALRLECTFFNDAVYSLRISDAEIVLKTYSGFRVRRDSLRVSDGQSGVYVLSGVKLVFKPVTVLYSDDGSSFAVVAAGNDASRKLTLNDSVVVGGKDIYDGKIVNIN